MTFLAPTYRKSFPVKLSACWKPDVCGALGKDSRQCSEMSRDCAEISLSLLILLGEELWQLSVSPLCPAHLTAPLPHSSRPAVKQHLELLSWVAAPWHSPSHTPTSVPRAGTRAAETPAQVVQRSCGIPHPWKCSSTGWTGLSATWTSGRCSCAHGRGLELGDL